MDEDVPDTCRFCGKGLTQEDNTDYTRDPINQPENIR